MQSMPQFPMLKWIKQNSPFISTSIYHTCLTNGVQFNQAESLYLVIIPMVSNSVLILFFNKKDNNVNAECFKEQA